MQFHDYVTLRKLWARERGFDRKLEAKAKSLSSHEFRKHILETLPNEMRATKNENTKQWLENQLRQAQNEQAWVELERPFYNVWPVTASLAKRVALDLPFSAMAIPFEFLVLRFAIGHEPHSVGIVMMQWERTRGHVALDCHCADTSDAPAFLFQHDYQPGECVEDWLKGIVRAGRGKPKFSDHLDDPQILSQQEFDEAASLMIRLAVFIALLAKGEDPITPVVLSKDQARYDATDDPDVRQWLERRAIQSVGRGFNVCKRLEIERSKSVHWRNPHLALFWTGPGRAKPIIKMRSGAIVQRVSMSEVPTGYLGPERDDEDDEDLTAIYFIETVGQNRIKIGKADDPEARLKTLQTGSASELKLLGVIMDKASREAELHAQLAEDRMHGEWFHATERLRQYIRDFAKPYKAVGT